MRLTCWNFDMSGWKNEQGCYSASNNLMIIPFPVVEDPDPDSSFYDQHIGFGFPFSKINSAIIINVGVGKVSCIRTKEIGGPERNCHFFPLSNGYL
jgi:hypothetical protein